MLSKCPIRLVFLAYNSINIETDWKRLYYSSKSNKSTGEATSAKTTVDKSPNVIDVEVE